MVLLVFWPWEKYYSAAPLGGRVVDEETREPIEGAYVVAVYVLNIGMEGGSRTPLHYEETVTDHEGRFHFNGFEKKSVPYERATRNAILGAGDPRVYVFSKGYLPISVARNIDSRIDMRSHRVSPLDGNDFPIKSAINTPISTQSEMLSRYVGGLTIELNSNISPATMKSVECAFNAIPETLSYIQRELKRFKLSGENYSSFSIQQPIHCFDRNQ